MAKDKNTAGAFLQDERGHFIRCLKCETETIIYNKERTEIFACPECRLLHKCAQGVYSSDMGTWAGKLDGAVLPLYSSCTFDREYIVVSCAQKYEKHDKEAWWEEYTLIDRSGSYAYLSMSYGRWI